MKPTVMGLGACANTRVGSPESNVPAPMLLAVPASTRRREISPVMTPSQAAAQQRGTTRSRPAIRSAAEDAVNCCRLAPRCRDRGIPSLGSHNSEAYNAPLAWGQPERQPCQLEVGPCIAPPLLAASWSRRALYDRLLAYAPGGRVACSAGP